MSDIVALLRFELRDWDGRIQTQFPSVNAVVIEKAANEIESLRSENEKLRAALTPEICEAYGV